MKPNEYWNMKLRSLSLESLYGLFNERKRTTFLSRFCDRDCKVKNLSFNGRHCYECPLVSERTLLKKVREIIPSRTTILIGREWETTMAHKKGRRWTIEGVAKKMSNTFVPFANQWGWVGETAEEVISDVKNRNEERFLIFLFMTEFM